MLSNKMTFSLTFLVMLLAIGLAVYTPSVMADGATHDFSVTISAAETMIDVVHPQGGNNIQIASGRDRASRALTVDSGTTGGDARTATLITLLITTQEVVNLGDPDAGVTGADLTGRSSAAIAADIDERAKAVLDDSDIVIDAYDADGRSLGILSLKNTIANVVLSHRDPTNPGKEFLLQVDESGLTNAYSEDRGGGDQLEIHTLLFSIPADTMQQADLGHVKAVREGHHGFHINKRSDVFRVDLVDDDEGEAEYNTGIEATRSGEGVPGVVAIQSLRERAGFIETGEFSVRVILTEEPKDGLKAEHVAVKKGVVKSITKGTTLKGGLAAITEDLTATPPVYGQDQRNSQLTPAMVNYYGSTGGTPTLVGTDTAAGDDGTYGDEFPEPTGRDNQFHQYFVTITPDPGYTGDVVISIKQFSDKVLPVGNMYVPLSPQEIVATTLTTAQENVRDSRVLNEMLTVQVSTGKDTVTTAYEARQKDVFDKMTNEIVLGNKTFIPAEGYLVLVADVGKAGIQASDAKTKDKTGPELKYNTHGLGLPFPADDLDAFFRNGGTLTLSYKDIPEATGSDHGDSKGATGDDATGYTAADSTAYAAGALIFNEIMWGLDAGSKDSQYIELHNPGTTVIGIDNKEWVITVGAAPAGFTVIDTVSNVKDPVTEKYWQVKGNGGVTAVTAEYPALIDLVSMSRITDATDGTAAASWSMSIRPSANLSGRRIGTPGAANNYDTSAQATAKAAAAAKAASDKAAADAAAKAAKVAVASPGDIKITEIMVASSNGRLPQWVELTNMSAGKVSLMGWSLVITNDPMDADVVGRAVSLDLGDVVVGVDAKGRKQSVLVVSKKGRSSGEGTGTGDLRADRIIDVQSQVSPGQAKYTLISEMGFTLTLVAPPGTGVRKDADVVGNLGMGWKIPMAEGNRSSIIRREMDGATEIKGTDAAGWKLASDSMMDGAYRETYYGQASDVGTPGYDAGGALPVELSKFSAARDRATGQVVITWETQSELNNAGFFIKRAQQKTAQFQVVNPTMIAGAGTTSEKQTYTYTDTTAQPNIVYYYQIEDVSLDGNRQTLTRSHRLKGHIGAAGKATTTWAELKEQQ